MKLLKDLYHEYQKHIFSYSLLLGVFMLLVGYSGWIPSGTIVEVLKVVGSVIISSGVFSAIVRSSQFTDIYKDELKKIIYCDEHLKERKDIHDLWHKTSRQLYQDKFPELSNKISNALKKYFPIDQEHYYEDYHYRIDISFAKDNPSFITLTEREEYTIVASGQHKEIEYNSYCSFNTTQKDNDISDYELVSFLVNDKLDMPSEKELVKKVDNKNGKITVKHKRVFVGENKYKISKEEVKTYSLDIENTKSHTANWLFNGYKMEVTYPKDLKLEFYEKGTHGYFKKEKRNINGVNFLTAKYDGLILPKQGVRLIFSK